VRQMLATLGGAAMVAPVPLAEHAEPARDTPDVPAETAHAAETADAVESADRVEGDVVPEGVTVDEPVADHLFVQEGTQPSDDSTDPTDPTNHRGTNPRHKASAKR